MLEKIPMDLYDGILVEYLAERMPKEVHDVDLCYQIAKDFISQHPEALPKAIQQGALRWKSKS